MLWTVPPTSSQYNATSWGDRMFLSKSTATLPLQPSLLPTTSTPPSVLPQLAASSSLSVLAGQEAQDQPSFHLPLVLTYSGLCVYYKEKRREQCKVHKDISIIFEIMEDFTQKELRTQNEAVIALIQKERKAMRRVLWRYYKIEEATENHLCLLQNVMRFMED